MSKLLTWRTTRIPHSSWQPDRRRSYQFPLGEMTHLSRIWRCARVAPSAEMIIQNVAQVLCMNTHTHIIIMSVVARVIWLPDIPAWVPLVFAVTLLLVVIQIIATERWPFCVIFESITTQCSKVVPNSWLYYAFQHFNHPT